jgi:hypothetical protein
MNHLYRQQREILRGLKKENPNLKTYEEIPLEALLVFEEIGIQKNVNEHINKFLRKI